MESPHENKPDWWTPLTAETVHIIGLWSLTFIEAVHLVIEVYHLVTGH